MPPSDQVVPVASDPSKPRCFDAEHGADCDTALSALSTREHFTLLEARERRRAIRGPDDQADANATVITLESLGRHASLSSQIDLAGLPDDPANLLQLCRKLCLNSTPVRAE